MADPIPDIGVIEQTVHQEIRQILAQRQSPIPPLANTQTLDNDLGLTSAERLHLFALLNMRLHVDPVAQAVSTVHVSTVGELCQRYQALLTEAVNAREMLRRSQQRAEARRIRRKSGL